MSKVVNGGKFCTAKKAREYREQGKKIQVGNYFEGIGGYHRLMYRKNKDDVMGISLRPTNPNKTVGKRSHKLFKNKGIIDINERVSAHLGKDQMSTTKLESEIDRLGHLANKIDASRSILKDQLWEIK